MNDQDYMDSFTSEELDEQHRRELVELYESYQPADYPDNKDFFTTVDLIQSLIVDLKNYDVYHGDTLNEEIDLLDRQLKSVKTKAEETIYPR